MSSIDQVVEAIAADLRTLINTVVADKGINPKTGKNTLTNSKLAQTAEVDVTIVNGSPVINVLFDNYIDFIEHGRKPRTGKQPPIDSLRDWALEHGIPTDNSTLFLISRAIWRDGVEGRPILATLEEEIDRRLEGEWGDMLSDALIDEIEKLFE